MLESIIHGLVELVESWGYLGILALMFIESTFIPFPSEVVMIPAGYIAFQGGMDPWLAVLMGLLGSILGAYFNYYFARVAGLPFLERYGRYFFVKPEGLERAMRTFRRHGEITTFVCRLFPVIRQLISLPAGLAGMNFLRFSFYTALGAGIWVAILTGFGWFVGSTFARMEKEPAGGLASTWEKVRGLWNEHELTIYLTIGIPLLLTVIIYVWWRRRVERSGRAGEAGQAEPAERVEPAGVEDPASRA